ncbi:MAG TPA: hypothetical protein VG734_12175 [Lacunisphaera sp.]|nr:hypothetical protein [Lacunisphaera sp.]
MHPPPVKTHSRPARWLVTLALLALAPKCVVCAAAYVGLGALLAFGGPELCGATSAAPGWPGWLAAAGSAGLLFQLVLHRMVRT